MEVPFSQWLKFFNRGYINFEHFPIFSGLKPNKSKREIASTGVLKRVHMAVCGMECVNL